MGFFPKCDQCDQDATYAARDIHEIDPVEVDGALCAQYKPKSPWKYGCDRHRVHGFTYDRIGEHDVLVDAMNIIAYSKLCQSIKERKH
jgi:hypothetical protein